MDCFKEVLITGGLGFIGSSITKRFLAESAQVTVVDSLVSNVASEEDFESGAVELKTCCIEDYLQQTGMRLKHDLVVHAASYVGPAGILQYSGAIAPHMLSVTSSVAEACIKSNVPLLFISSSEVYGADGLLQEDMDVRVPSCFNARLEYALAKLTSEAILTNLHSRGLRSVSIRPFNVVGSRQSRVGGFVIPTFVQQALANKTLTVFDTGEQKRSFVSVEDLADFVVEHLRKPVFNSNPRINVGNPNNACTINELAHKVVALVSSESPIKHVDPQTIYGPLYKEAASRIKLCDISKAQGLGWSPSRSLDRIIVEAADYFRTHRDIRGSDVRERSY